jgi:hypothetical protein
MNRDGDKIEVSTEEASGGIKKQGVRYVLAISLALAVITLTLMWVGKAIMD